MEFSANGLALGVCCTGMREINVLWGNSQQNWQQRRLTRAREVLFVHAVTQRLRNAADDRATYLAGSHLPQLRDTLIAVECRVWRAYHVRTVLQRTYSHTQLHTRSQMQRDQNTHPQTFKFSSSWSQKSQFQNEHCQPVLARTTS